ncbi:calpain-like protein [Niveomyces insectorum RCEF 264]|uniref:Calpain-like protein n=1 Tax=Niveomyces insectorum RCEF 264 TaxID=1081102 RepID=A0A167USN9_9HYPO|nr:calpain-like protein [Niveomyces insectorum RCEF 264]
MRSHLAARTVYRRCVTHRSHEASLLAASAGAAPAPPACSRLQPARSVSRYARRRPEATAATVTAPTSQPQHGVLSTTTTIPPTQKRTFLGAIRKSPPRALKAQQVEPGYDVLLRFRASVAEDTRRPPRAELLQAFRDFFGYKLQYGKRVNATQAEWFGRLYDYLQTTSLEEEEKSGTTGLRGSRREELSLEDLRTAREALAKPPSAASNDSGCDTTTDEHLAFCQTLYAELQRRGVSTAADVKRQVVVLCQYGASLEAIELLAGYWHSSSSPPTSTTTTTTSPTATATATAMATARPQPEVRRQSRRDKELWVLLLQGLAREGREADLLREAAAAEAAGLEYMPLFQEIMTTFYAQRDDLAKTRLWFAKPLRSGGNGGSGRGGRLLSTPATYAALLALAQRRPGDAATQEWVQATFETLCESNPSKPLWDVVLQWAVAVRGHGVDEVRRMLATVAEHTKGVNAATATATATTAAAAAAPFDAATINGLVRVAADRGDVLLAERFVQLGADLGIPPDVHTCAMQLAYRVAAADLSGAYASFMRLQELDYDGGGSSSSSDGVVDAEEAAAPALNQYLRALCAAVPPPLSRTSPNNDNGAAAGRGRGRAAANAAADPLVRICDVLDTIEQRSVALEPVTVVALCRLFLRHDRLYDVIDVLSVHALQFSVRERAVVRDEAFVAYIVDEKGTTSTARAWDAYALLRQYFAETPPDRRVRIMDGFFRRGRPDLACYVFGHMRAAREPAQRPTAALYVRCLEGLGRCPDATALQLVHNMLKTDTLVTVNGGLDTTLYNALMLAYAACGDRERALAFWPYIDGAAAAAAGGTGSGTTETGSGPTYASLEILFWVCEGLPFGDAQARAVWAKLQRLEIDVPPAVYDAYIGALAGQGHVAEAQALIDGMEKSAGYGPTMMTLGIAHNALPGQSLQAEFAAWATTAYPAAWQQLCKRGCRSTLEGLRRYKIRRELKA